MNRQGSEASLWVGTSGWVYKHWMGLFYPEKMPSPELLPFFAQRFPTVEVNNSFYRLPPRTVFESWRRRTPDGYLFAVKASRFLTHIKKLNEPEEPLQRFMDNVTGLGDKLGPILFQFPRTWPIHLERLSAFLEALQAYPPQRYTFEFRHQSWLTGEVYERLGKAGAALCLPLGPGVPLDVRLTAPWTYIRFHAGQHGTGFTDAELTAWAERIRGFLDQGADTYVYFNNDPGGHALYDAERLCLLLGREPTKARLRE